MECGGRQQRGGDRVEERQHACNVYTYLGFLKTISSLQPVQYLHVHNSSEHY